MDKFLLILFFIIKILVIVVAPIVLFIFRKKELKSIYIWLEVIALLAIIVLYIIGFSYMVDSNISNILNIRLLSESKENTETNLDNDINISNATENLEPITDYQTHKGEKVYYYNGFSMPLAARKITCDGGYDYYKYYSDIITSTAMLLSTYFDKQIDPVEIYDKAVEKGLIECGVPIDRDKFFAMITIDYKVDFNIINTSQLENYMLNGMPVLLETIGNGNLSCGESYFLVYDVDNAGDFYLLDPNNKSYEYICPDGTIGFGSVLKANYNEEIFSIDTIKADASRLIVIGGTRK